MMNEKPNYVTWKFLLLIVIRLPLIFVFLIVGVLNIVTSLIKSACDTVQEQIGAAFQQLARWAEKS